jgi:CRP-like cAMP-binding protein
VRYARAPSEERLAPTQKTFANRILTGLSAGDFALLQPSLSAVDLPVRRQLEIRNRKIEHVYFLESGLASVVVSAGAHQSIEVGIIGSEGMTGLAVLLESDRATHETFIQTAGHGWRIPAEELRLAMDKSATLHRHLLRYAYTLFTQLEFTALANGRYNTEERLARWLLMADDRADGNAIHLTHEFLGIMLGARRPAVTNALNEFQKRGVVKTQRGTIALQDREALEAAANGSYGGPEAEYRRLFGEVSSSEKGK